MTSQTWNSMMDDAAAGFEVLPDGDYDCRVKSSVAKLTANGKRMYECIFEVTSGPYAGRQIWNNFVVSPENPAALGILKAQFAVLGLTEDWLRQEPSDDQVAAALVGRQARLKLSHREFNGQNRNDVKGVSPIGQVGAPPPPAGMPPPQAAVAVPAPPQPPVMMPPVQAPTQLPSPPGVPF